MEIEGEKNMAKITVSTLQGYKTFKAYPFDAYIGEISAGGKKNGYYIVLAQGTKDLTKEVAKDTFAKKADAEKVIRKWMSAKLKQYEGEVELKRMKGSKKRKRR